MPEPTISRLLGDASPELRAFVGVAIPLLASHLVADFPLQPARRIQNRREHGWGSSRLYAHALVAGALGHLAVAVALGSWRVWWVLPAIGVTHCIIDGIKARCADGVLAFIGDQIAHVAVLAALAVLLARTYEAAPHGNALGWPFLAAILVLWWASGIFIGIATRPWRPQLAPGGDQGLPDAGLWIGRLERGLIFLFVLLHRYEAIGFLVAAKSILRFGELTRPEHRKEAEYVLVGTMASFLIAILTALAVQLWLHVMR